MTKYKKGTRDDSDNALDAICYNSQVLMTRRKFNIGVVIARRISCMNGRKTD